LQRCWTANLPVSTARQYALTDPLPKGLLTWPNPD
jgi:hypothetical protein